ncbi:MAG: PAS domain S-box protein [Porticoccaceae bacterium]|nr:PAS domain S-box protein [Porticoccaceae bacterium]
MNKELVTEIDFANLLVNQSPDAIIFADLSGVIRVWNTAAERIFGFSADVAIGASLDIIIPESFREAHWQGFNRAIADSVTKFVGQALPTKALRADGTEFYVELSFAIILDKEGKPLGSVAHARDIDERFIKERANRRRLKELEAEVVK